MVLGKVDSHIQQNASVSQSYSIQKKKSIQNGLGLNIRLKIIKLLKGNKDNKLLYISLSDAVSYLTPKQRQKSTNK